MVSVMCPPRAWTPKRTLLTSSGGFVTQAIRSGKPERHVKEHSGHASWEPSNRYVEEAGTFQDNLPEDIDL